MSRLILIIAIVSVIMSCGGSSKESGLSDPKVLNGSWKLIKILQDTIRLETELTEQQPNIDINIGKKTIRGYSGCNYFSGEFSIRKDSLKFGALTATQIGCSNRIEGALFKRLEIITRYRLSKDSLEFIANNKVLLLFKRDDTSKNVF